MEKRFEYAAIISAKITELLDENSESDFHISTEELNEDDNLTEFCHALLNLAPFEIVSILSNAAKDVLELNYLANRLCFQFLTQKNDEVKEEGGEG
jgi:hypothetical protein